MASALDPLLQEIKFQKTDRGCSSKTKGAWWLRLDFNNATFSTQVLPNMGNECNNFQVVKSEWIKQNKKIKKNEAWKGLKRKPFNDGILYI